MADAQAAPTDDWWSAYPTVATAPATPGSAPVTPTPTTSATAAAAQGAGSTPTATASQASPDPVQGDDSGWWSQYPAVAAPAGTPGIAIAAVPQKDTSGNLGIVTSEALRTGLAANPLGMAMNTISLAGHAGDYLGDQAYRGEQYIRGNPVPSMKDIQGARDAQAQAHQNEGGVKGWLDTTTDRLTAPFPSTDDLAENALQKVDSGLTYPQSGIGKLADTITQFAAGGAAGAKSLPEALLNAVKSVPAAVTSEGAGALTQGTDFEVPARLAAGIAGQHATEATGRMANRAGIGAKTDVPNADGNGATPATEGQMQAATDNVTAAATNPDNLAGQTYSGLWERGSPTAAPGELLPGAQPSLAEVVPDQGLAQRQNAIAQKLPEPFQQKAQDSQTAAADTLAQGEQTGDPQDLAAFAADKLKAEQDAADQSATTQKAANDTQQTALQTDAQAKMQGVGEYGNTPDNGGTGNPVLDAQAVRKQNESEAWSATDHVQDAPATISSTEEAAQQVLNSENELGNAKLPSGVKTIADQIVNRDPNAPITFDTLKKFRTQLSDASGAAAASGDAASLRHLTVMKQALDGDLENSINGVFENEGQQVAEGALHPEDTLYNKLSADRDEYLANQKTGTGGSSSGSAGGNATGRSQVLPSERGAKVSQDGGSGSAEGAEGLQGSEPHPNLSKEDIEKYQNARAVTYSNSILNDFDKAGIVDSNGNIVPDKYDAWKAKPANARRLLQAKDLNVKLDDASAAQRELDMFQKWRNRDETQKQQDALKDITTRSRSNLGKFADENADPTSLVGKIFNNTTLDSGKQFADLVEQVKSDPKALAGLRNVVSNYIRERVAKAQPSENGHPGKMSGQNSFQKFINLHQEALQHIYGDDPGLQNIRNVAAELARRSEYSDRVNIKGQSNTNKNAEQNKRSMKSTVYDFMKKGLASIAPAGGLFLAKHFLHSEGMGELFGLQAGEALKHVLNKMQGNGLGTVQRIEAAMYANPAFAHTMFQKYGGPRPSNAALNRVGAEAMKIVPFIATTQSKADNK